LLNLLVVADVKGELNLIMTLQGFVLLLTLQPRIFGRLHALLVCLSKLILAHLLLLLAEQIPHSWVGTRFRRTPFRLFLNLRSALNKVLYETNE